MAAKETNLVDFESKLEIFFEALILVAKIRRQSALNHSCSARSFSIYNHSMKLVQD